MDLIRVCLVRHGETDWNVQKRMQGREDIELNEKGKIQARECVEKLKDFQWDFVVSSPLKRAKETAEIIAENLDIELKECIDELIEKDFGIGSGMFVHEIIERYGFDNIPQMETDEVLCERCKNVLKRFEKFENKNIIAVTHAGIIEKMIKFSGGNVNIEKIKNGVNNILKFENGKWSTEK